MESAISIVRAVAISSLWLTVSGLVLWLFLVCRWRLSPGTRAAAGLLILLQGWMWFAIPLPVDAGLFAPHWFDLGQPRPRTVSAPEMHSAHHQPTAGGNQPDSQHWPPSAVVATLGQSVAFIGLTVWVGGMAILLGRSLWVLVALARMVRGLPAAPAAWQAELSKLADEWSIHKPIELKVSQVAAPMLVRTWNSVLIVVPEWLWRSNDRDQRAAILRHELEHFRRADVWRQLVVRLLLLPHWFNPVAWWAARQCEDAREAACDDAACAGDPHRALAFSRALLVLNERQGIRYAQAMSVSGGSLVERIHRLLHPELRKESRMRKYLLLSSLLVLAGLATIRLRAADESPSADAATEGAQAPLIPNGGFEEIRTETGDPVGWFGTRLPRTAGRFDLSIATAPAHNGQHSVMVSIGQNHPDERVDYNWTIDAQGWQAGETFELVGWIKVENATHPAVMMAQFLDEFGQRLLGAATTEKSSPIVGTADWTKVSTRFVVPEGTRIVRIRTGLSSQGNSGAKAWFDDLSLVKVAP